MLAAASLAAALAWSSQPPGLHPVDAPQFVAVTFDDNFVSGLGDESGGMTWATDFFRSLHNPPGNALLTTFDASPVRTSFYNNCVYLQDEDTRKSWATAAADGHEVGNHTVNHTHGGSFTAQAWSDEIAPCTAALGNPESGVGITSAEIIGFRAPFLAYGTELYPALLAQGLKYDSSIQSCWGAGQDGKNCGWPHTLDQGSPDALDLSSKFAMPSVPSSAGLWEASVSALFVPPDELAAQYGIAPGLRTRIPTDMPAPSYYDSATGRIAGLDITLFVDAGLSAAEVLATLKYTLDLRLAGNRAPFVFIGHTHVYGSSYGAAAQAPGAGDRQGAIEDFIEYALSKPMVRMRPVADILAWMSAPTPLGGVVTMPLGGGGTGGGAGSATGGASGSPAGGVSGVSGAPPISGATSSAGTGGMAATMPSSATTPSGDAACACRLGTTSSSSSGAVWLFALVAGAFARRGRRTSCLSARGGATRRLCR
jgi:hypothetical protein